MKIISKRRKSGMTFVELIVVLAVLALLASLFLPEMGRSKSCHGSQRISCVNNLKEVGIAYRLWAGDNGDLVPAQQTVSSNGWRDFLTNGNAGPKCWMNYAAMGNDMGQSPKLVLCPSDDRQMADSFTNNFSNLNVSYFVGVGANDVYPQSIAGGDRNLDPGAKPDLDYGFSPKDGRGNDVAIPVKGTVSWSLKIHSAGNTTGAGNILLGDGSCQQVSSANFNQNWLRNAQDSGNWPAGHVPATPSIRFVFP